MTIKRGKREKEMDRKQGKGKGNTYPDSKWRDTKRVREREREIKLENQICTRSFVYFFLFLLF